MQYRSKQYFEKFGLKPFHIFFSALILVFFLAPSIIKGEDCDFSHLSKDVPLISEYTIDVTEKIKDDSGSWRLMKKALPNVQRVFVSKEPYFIVLVGWAESWDDIAKFTREQTKGHFSSLAEIGKSNAEKQGQEYTFRFSSDDPLTTYVNLTYLDGGHPFRDIAMDIVATPNCVVSIKLSGRTDELGPQYWQTVADQFELMREVIAKKYGTVQFSSSGSRIWWRVFGNVVFWLFVITISALFLSSVYLIKFSVTPSPSTRKYSVFIMVLAVFMLTITILVNEWLDIQSGQYTYETVPHFILIFLVHLWAYMSNKPRVVAFALWLIAVSIIAQIGFWLSGWAALKTGNWVGIILGSVLVTYTLVKSSIFKGRKEVAT